MPNIISIQFGFLGLFISLGVGAVGSLIFRNNDRLSNWWGNLSAIAGSIFGIISSLSIITSGNIFSYNIPTSFPLLSVSLKVDALSAFFIFVISLISLFASIYAIGYVKHFYKKYNIGSLEFFYNIFIAGMMLVVSAHQALFFLISWEIMSAASYFLVIFERKEKENIKAGAIYFIMTHMGTAFIISLFLILYKFTGSFDFETIKNSAALIPSLALNTIFILGLIGFGAKAGIIPLHIWLPNAHPAAPSHVSALMSGVMIKTGIYMLIRLFWDMLPHDTFWWGIAVLIIGSVSSILGVLYALTEHDIKKLLAYHSIENIGIILLGFGSALTFYSLGLNSLAILGIIASLFHILNHAVFKALLFLGAGSVVSQTHTRNIEEYGGLIKLMPYTGLFFLIGSMAISALPPFNGFASEWLTFQALFQGMQTLNTVARGVFILAAGSLAFTGGLAAACFVKAFGITFLARPRSEKAKHAKESGISLRIGMAGLAILALLFGIFSGPISSLLSKIAGGESPLISENYGMQLKNGFATVSMPAIFIILVLALASVVVAVFIAAGKRKIKNGITWDCGSDLSPRMEITSTGFARSIITIFGGILKPTRQTDVEYHDANMRYFPKFKNISLGINDVYSAYIYGPLEKTAEAIANAARKIQSGNINAYIFYIFIVLIALLLFAV
ncbi:MAG: hydrogenase 4 subunit B [bacterium]|nr:hydrogenase 4 subunit B [bacterium]